MRGVLGLNILGDRGYSEDETVAYVKALSPAYCVVLNNPSLAARLVPYTTVIVRRMPDDDAQNHENGRDFVGSRHADVPKGAYLYCGNEPGRDAAGRLNQFTLEAQGAAAAFDLKLCILNWSTGVPEPANWDVVAPCVSNAVKRGDLIGVHNYYNGSPLNNFSYPWHVGRFRDAKQRFGGQWVVTELGYLKLKPDGKEMDGGKGWGYDLSADKYALHLEKLANYYAAFQVGACLFSWPDWDAHQFGIEASDTLRQHLIAINQQHTLKETPVTQPILRADLGEPVEGYIASLKANLVNVRSLSSATSQVLGTLYKGDKLTYREITLKAGGFDWYAVEAPWIGWMADVARPAPGTPEQPLLKLDVPYCSQLAVDASAYNNDCGPAVLLMQMQFWRKSFGWGFGKFPTVDDVARHTKLSGKDQPLNLADLDLVAHGYGQMLSLLQNLTPDAIIEKLKAGTPVGILVNYGDFYPQDSFKGGHYALVTGYNDHTFWVHDSYRGGQDYKIARSQLDAALKNTSAFAGAPYQGFTLS